MLISNPSAGGNTGGQANNYNGTRRIPVVFADYKIGNPSAGPANTEDRGVVEFLVVFEPAT